MNATRPYVKSQQETDWTRGPTMFYGYCSETGRMRMMDFPDYAESVRKTYSDMYQNVAKTMQSWSESAQRWMPSAGRYRHDVCCEPQEDCHCTCCIRDADSVEYTHCGETRIIPFTFENDTRRERNVKLELSSFATSSGREVDWKTSLLPTEFQLPPCGEKTVLLTVVVDCGMLAGNKGTQKRAAERSPSVDECKVLYATIRAEGCFIRPLVVAVAVLPNDCGAHRARCQCECCC
jgi:hypothetical protein